MAALVYADADLARRIEPVVTSVPMSKQSR
jgi:hypothetical protein